MKFLAPIALIASLASSAYAQFTINSLLNVVVCQPSLITWVGGTAPYFLSILPAGQPSANALVDFGQVSGTSVTWLANLGVGTSAFLNLRDSTGALAQSGTFTVLAGSNSSCVGQPVSTSAGPGGDATSTPVSPGSSSSKAATSTGSSTSTPKPSSAAAPSNYANAGAAAMIGAALLSLVL
ncbi:hypothetical protein M413DRAFT_446740 [Hebeloma cylindrosporum]|uniref:Uncharacterized protein n=1 Tax=Hebeloma cylindrosporum TaxID=76867 RepID=A0A0C3C6D9_HEBCY|nr:hypothetical protein M413DRAFT_446740 [Hebeloma cylindrosporum h7]